MSDRIKTCRKTVPLSGGWRVDESHDLITYLGAAVATATTCTLLAFPYSYALDLNGLNA